MPVVLYCYETWSVTLWEDCRLRIFENRILSPGGMRKRSGGGSTVRNLRSLYPSPNIVKAIKYRRLSWAGQVARMKESRNSFKLITRIPTGKRPLGKF